MGNRYYNGPVSDHFDGERFFNPGLRPSDKSLLNLLTWRLGGRRTPWPERVFAVPAIVPDTRVQELRITLVGHASLLIQCAGVNLLVDPVWSERASPFRFAGPRRHNPPAIPFEDLPPIHAVLITHNHYDHLDVATVKRLWQNHRPQIFTPLGNDTILQVIAPELEVTTGDWWDRFELPGGLTATVTPAYHWSSRGMGDYRMALWGGFFLQTPQGSVYLAGDTAMRTGAIFGEMRERLGSPLVAVLPIGAYAPRWFMQTQHANPAEALKIAEIVGAEHLLGVHWGTFPLTDEPFDEPEQMLRRAAPRYPGLQTIAAMRPGTVWDLPRV